MSTGDPDVAEAEARLEALAPGYLARVRSAAAALAVDAHGGAEVMAEVVAVREAAELDLDVPTASSAPAGAYAKLAIKRATSWYLRYLTVQLTVFARAVASMGESVAAQLDRLDGADAELSAGLEQLRRRVELLEGGGG